MIIKASRAISTAPVPAGSQTGRRPVRASRRYVVGRTFLSDLDGQDCPSYRRIDPAAPLTCRCGALASQVGTDSSSFAVTSAPIRALTAKLAEKPRENRQEWDGKWRQLALFRGSKRHSRRARSRWPRIANRWAPKLCMCGPRSPPAAYDPPNRQSSASFH